MNHSPRAWQSAPGAAVSATGSTAVANLVTFVRDVTREFYLSGVFARGATDPVLSHRALSARLVCIITPNANIAGGNSCVLCVIVHGAAGKYDTPGTSGLFPKYAVGVTGQ